MQALSVLTQSSQVTEGRTSDLGWNVLYKKDVERRSLSRRRCRGGSSGQMGSHDPYWDKSLRLTYEETSVQLIFNSNN